MMDNVGVDNAMEEVTANEAKISINCCQRALDKGPTVLVVVRHVRMRVV